MIPQKGKIMLEIAIFTLILTAGVFIWTIVSQNRVIKRQEDRIGDLLDRLMAKDYTDYAVSRERMTVAEKIQAATTNFVDQHGDLEEIRVD